MKIQKRFVEKYLTPRGLPESLFRFEIEDDVSSSDESEDQSVDQLLDEVFCNIYIKQFGIELWCCGDIRNWGIYMRKYKNESLRVYIPCDIDKALDNVARQYKLQQAYDAALIEITTLREKILEMGLRFEETAKKQ